jgi:N-acetylglutamate synthase-like GNAT family acetyltransferase
VKWQVYELGSPAISLDLVPLAISDGKVVGFATMRTLLDETLGELRMVAVLPDWRGRGIASALLAAQAAGARRAGVQRLSAWVPDDGPAALYRKPGFDEAATFVALEGPLPS